MTPEELKEKEFRDEEEIEKALTGLRTLPNFEKAVLQPLREEFVRHLDLLANASPEDAEKYRGVVFFIYSQYEDLAGESLVR